MWNSSLYKNNEGRAQRQRSKCEFYLSSFIWTNITLDTAFPHSDRCYAGNSQINVTWTIVCCIKPTFHCIKLWNNYTWISSPLTRTRYHPDPYACTFYQIKFIIFIWRGSCLCCSCEYVFHGVKSVSACVIWNETVCSRRLCTRRITPSDPIATAMATNEYSSQLSFALAHRIHVCVSRVQINVSFAPILSVDCWFKSPLHTEYFIYFCPLPSSHIVILWIDKYLWNNLFSFVSRPSISDIDEQNCNIIIRCPSCACENQFSKHF